MASTKRAYKLQEFVAHLPAVNCLRIGRKSSRVLVTGGDDCKVNLWSIGKPNPTLSLGGHSTGIESVTFDPSEVLVGAGAASGTVKIWDLEEAKIVRTLSGHRSNCMSVDFHPFGEFFASGSLDTNLKIWDIRKKRCIHTYKGHTSGITKVRFSPDGRWVVSAGDDSSVKLWDLTAGKMLHDFKCHGGRVESIDFHPHEFLLATGGRDRTVKFWDLETFELICSSGPEASPVRCLAFNPDGRTLLCGLHESIKVLSWEPLVCHDSVDVGWSSLSDLNIHEGKLLACSHNQSCVGVWVVDISCSGPYLKCGGVPFNHSGNESKSVTTPTTPPLTESPVNTFEKLAVSEHSYKLGFDMKKTTHISCGPPYTEAVAPSYDKTNMVKYGRIEFPVQSPVTGMVDDRKERSFDNVIGRTMPFSLQSRSAAVNTPSSIHDDGFTEFLVSSPPTVNSRDRTQQLFPEFLRSQDPRLTNSPMPSFTPHHHPFKGTYITQEKEFNKGLDSMEVLMDGHDQFVSSMYLRFTKFRMIYDQWRMKGVKGALIVMEKMGDDEVTADVMSILSENEASGVVTLEIFTSIIPLLTGLLYSNIDRHLVISLEVMLKLVKVFGPVIQSTISSSSPVGIDIEAEQRFERCRNCAVELQKAKDQLPALSRRGGVVGRSCGEVIMAIHEILSEGVIVCK